MLKITAYAERLLGRPVAGGVACQQHARNAEELDRPLDRGQDFRAVDVRGNLRVFTTRPDTLFGATWAVSAPEHPLVDITSEGQRVVVAEYRAAAASARADLQRQELDKEKTVFTGGMPSTR
ncbi:MAG: hypothetical protein U0231_05720 [Nitrospiraceae bacterium]